MAFAGLPRSAPVSASGGDVVAPAQNDRSIVMSKRAACVRDALREGGPRKFRRAARIVGQDRDRRFGAMAREMILERVENAQREAGPDRRTEIKRHPGNLVLPLGKVVGHDPTRADVAETLERAEMLAAIGNPGPPSAQVHRDVDGDEKPQIACNPCYRDGEHHANRAIQLRLQPATANSNGEEDNSLYRISEPV